MSLELTVTPSRSRLNIGATVAVYKPLLIGIAFTVIFTYLLELVRSNQGWVMVHQLMNAFMGFFFIVFALPKFLHVSAFAKAFRQYDIISKKVRPYATAYPFIELGLGLLLLCDYPTNSFVGNGVINSVIAVITGFGMVGVMQALRQKKRLDCACMGSAFSFPLSKVAVVENGLMFVMALAMVLTFNPNHMSMISLTPFGH